MRDRFRVVPFVGLSLGPVVLATCAKLAIGRLVQTDADAFFLAAAAFAAWRAGAAGGFVSVAVAAIAQMYFFVEPRGTFRIDAAADVFGLLSWIGEGALVCVLVAALNAKRERADATSAAQRTINEHTEQALSASERAYHVMFDASPVAMYLFDPSSLRFTAVNDAAVALYGYSRDEFLGMRLVDLKLAEDRSGAEASIRDDRNADFRATVTHQKRDGSKISVQVISRALVLHDKLSRLCVVRDETEHERLETQLRHAQKMEAVGRLAGGIAHDFNNMLAVILGCTWALVEDAKPGSEDHEALTEIMRAGERAAELTKQLLAFSHQSPRRVQVVDANEVVRDARKLLVRLVGEDIEVVAHTSDVPCTSELDPAQIEQILMNLAVNARDAMPRGGKLTLETNLVSCDATFTSQHAGMIPGDYVMLAVSDNGTGMDATTQSRLFEPFFTTKEVGKGTGLGLAIVFGIVKQHGGHIWLYSEPGHGTTFKIYFPVAEATGVSSASRMAPPPVPQGHETVLVVEDEEQVLRLTARTLRKCGYTVLTARHPSDALALCAPGGAPIDLLVTDVIMPTMNGRELSERILAMRPATKVLFTSGYTDNVVLDQGINASWSFLQKPVMPDALARKVREILSGKVAHAAA